MNELRQELTRQREATEQAEQHWIQQVSEWNSEREQLQAERAEWQMTQQAFRDELEQLQAKHQAELDHWRTEYDLQLATSQQQQTEWSAEHTRVLEEMLKLEDQLDATRAELEQQQQRSLQASEQHQSEQARLNQLAEELRVERERLDRELSELKAAQITLQRDQQVIEHSWNWLHSERRQLTQEKTRAEQELREFTAEREQQDAESDDSIQAAANLAETQSAWDELRAAQQAFQEEKQRWEEQCRHAEIDFSASMESLQSTRAELDAFRQHLDDEATRTTTIAAELEVLRADLTAARCQLEEQRQAFLAEQQERLVERNPTPSTIEDSWTTVDVMESRNETPRVDADSTSISSEEWTISTVATEVAAPQFDEPWSIGVDLTSSAYRGREELTESTTASDSTRMGSTSSNVDSPAAVNSDWNLTDSPTSLSSPTSAATSHSVGETDNATESKDSRTETGHESLIENRTTASNEADTPTDEDPAAKLRKELAAMFNLPGLNSSHGEVATEPPATEPPTESIVSAEPLPTTPEPTKADAVEAGSTTEPATQPIASTTESPDLSTPQNDHSTEKHDENIDDSVSRYMEHLLARSRSRAEQFSGSSSPSSAEPTPPPPVTRPKSPLQLLAEQEADTPLPNPVVAVPNTPSHSVDKDALRAATEKMRQVANLQTLKNVESNNWKQIKSSIKTKSALAVLSFLLSIGLLWWGMREQPEFIVLGACAACIGMLTWIDLFVAIRATRSRSAQLAIRQVSGKEPDA